MLSCFLSLVLVRGCLEAKSMASGRTLLEYDEKKPLGFFPKLYETIVKSLGEKNMDRLQELRDDPEELIR